jgi:hypothetical protein
MFGPYFFEGPVNQGTYLTMLRDFCASVEALKDCLDKCGFRKKVAQFIMQSPWHNSSTKCSETSGLAVNPSIYRRLLSSSPEIWICHPVKMQYGRGRGSSNRRLPRSGTDQLMTLKKLFVRHLLPLLQQC